MRKLTADRKYLWLPEPPLDIAKPYALGNYAFDDVSSAIAKKYLDRTANLKRAWTRICTHLPETVETDEKLTILEFSTAHGAMLEVWSALGHDAQGTDYCVPKRFSKRYKQITAGHPVFASTHSQPIKAVQSGWIYQPVIESIGAKVHLFNAGQVPYDFEDNSFDYICCYQAIEAYAAPADWDKIVSEFCRIARRGVVIGFNPPPLRAKEADSWENTKAAWENLRKYKKNGFTNRFFEFEETNRGFHPSACKLIADNL
jgi:hypothetical protein